MNNGIVVNHQVFIFADGAVFAVYWWGLINRVKILVQELGGQRGEEASFQRGLIFGRIRYLYH